MPNLALRSLFVCVLGGALLMLVAMSRPALAQTDDGVIVAPTEFKPIERLSLFSGFAAGKPFAPKTVTVWLPKGVSLLSDSVKPCSEAKARRLGTPKGCTKFAAGMVKHERVRGWFAFAGPKRGNQRLVWLRVRDENLEGNFLTDFGTGVISKVSGAYATKVVLRVGSLGFTTQLLEVVLPRLRARGKCPAGGWRYRVKLETPQGTAERAGRTPCSALSRG
jgi:hypothetical protein